MPWVSGAVKTTRQGYTEVHIKHQYRYINTNVNTEIEIIEKVEIEIIKIRNRLIES